MARFFEIVQEGRKKRGDATEHFPKMRKKEIQVKLKMRNAQSLREQERRRGESRRKTEWRRIGTKKGKPEQTHSTLNPKCFLQTQ